MTKTAFVRRKRITLGLCSSVATLLVCATGDRVSAQTTKPWRHVVIEPKSDAGELLMPFKRGFADKLGLPVEIISVKDDELALKAVISGAADSYEGGPAATILADAHGADVKVIGCTWITVPHGIFVHSDITTLDQLRGKSIAVAAPGSFPDIFARVGARQIQHPCQRRQSCKHWRQPRPLSRSDAARRRRSHCFRRGRTDCGEGGDQNADLCQRSASTVHPHVPARECKDDRGAAGRYRQIARRQRCLACAMP